MESVFCSICQLRISEWMKACGKTTQHEGKEVHKACLMDLSLKYGKLKE